MTIEIVTCLSQLKRYKNQWNELYNKLPSLTPFQSFEWSYFWLKHLLGKKKIYIVLCFYNNELLAIWPCWVRKIENYNILELIGSRGTDYLMPICSAIYLSSTIEQLLHIPGIDCIYFTDLPVEFTAFLNDFCITENGNCLCYSLSLINGWDGIVKNLSSRHRKDISYHRRYISKYLGMAEISLTDNIDNIYTYHTELHNNRLQCKNSLGVYKNQAVRLFFYDFFKAMGNNTLVSTLAINHKIIASIISVIKGDVVFPIHLGFDIDYKKYRPGSVLLGYLLEYLSKNNYTCFDLSRGHDQYKLNWKCNQKTNINILITKAKNDHLVRLIKTIDQKIGFVPNDQ